MNIQWDSRKYADDFSFVPQYGEAVMELLTVSKGSRVIDLGCGNGTLSEKLAERGYQVIGIDDSETMIELAKKKHPDITFRKENALSFRLDEPTDAVFSNAVFHWIDEKDQMQLLTNISENLRDGGELVTEFGGYGCADAVHKALETEFSERGLHYFFAFYFPTIGMYAPMMEKAGLKVDYAILFDRPTEQKSEDGLAEWVRMFNKKPFEGMGASLQEEIIRAAERKLRPVLYRDGHWFIDYVRIRMRARKI